MEKHHKRSVKISAEEPPEGTGPAAGDTEPQEPPEGTGTDTGDTKPQEPPEGTGPDTGDTEPKETAKKRKRKRKRVKYSFQTVSRCPRCGSTNTGCRRTDSVNGVQYRQCKMPVCRWKYVVKGTPA